MLDELNWLAAAAFRVTGGLDVSRAESLFGFRARVEFEEGLGRTVEWFRERHAKMSSEERLV